MKIIILILLLFDLTSNLFAQDKKTDSTVLKAKFAISDAKHFKLDKQVWKAYRKHGINYTSDYFKPTTINTAHSELLTDSVYVKAFREAAYKKTTRKRTFGHYVLVGGGIYVAAIVVGGVVAIIGIALGFIKI